MITYQIDRKALQKLNNDMRELTPVLAEIAPTLQSVLDIVSQHAATINTPTINEFRNELQTTLTKAVGLARATIEDTQKLISVSEQAGKHLAAIEEYFGSALREVPSTPEAEAVAATVEEPQKDVR